MKGMMKPRITSKTDWEAPKFSHSWRNIISYLKYFSCRVHSCIRSMWRLIRVYQNTSLPNATNQGARKRSETNERAPRGPMISLQPRAGKISLLPRSAGRTKVVPEEGAGTRPIARAQRLVDRKAPSHSFRNGNVSSRRGWGVNPRPTERPSDEV